MHEPVLLKETLDHLSPKKGESYLDATAGFGGHASAILKVTQSYKDSVLVDRDQIAVEELQIKFTQDGLEIFQNDFFTAANELALEGKHFDLIFADLGVSSQHLNIASRGFSFSNSGPLDMRMDQRQELTAEIIVNEWNERDLAQIIRKYGEEPHSWKIARSIVTNRPIKTTEELASIITRTTGKWQAKHPATRTFQAIRIAVNNELGLLESTLPIWLDLLKPGGRIGIISFHSLEDRIVKQFFAEHSGNTYDAVLRLITKNPVVAGNQELVNNPRSRSAKLRVAAKIKTTERASDAH